MSAPTSLPYAGQMDAEIYHADPIVDGSLSSTGARKLLPPSCPAIFDYERRHPPRPTAAFSFGHAAHAEVLGAGRPMVVIPDEILASNGATSTKDAKAFIAAAEGAGQTPVKSGVAKQVTRMADAIRMHPVAGKLFDPESGTPEVAMFWTDERTGVVRRGMVDWMPNVKPGRFVIPDYKTAESASPEDFSKALWRYGYAQQAAWYIDGVQACVPMDDVGFVFVVQEKSPPYLVSVFEPDATALLIARQRNAEAIDVYKRCTDAGLWPGYSDGVEIIGLPYWVENEYLEMVV